MKKILMAVIMFMALVLCVSMAAAAVTVESSFSSENPTFGDEDQMASNPNADDEADEDIFDNGEVTLNSTAAVSVVSIGVVPESGFSESDLNITLDDVDLDLAAGVSEAITLEARIPEQLDAVDSSLTAEAFKVAVVTFTFSDASTVATDVFMQRRNMLVFDKIYVDVDGNRDNYDDGDSIDDEAKPGDDIEVEVKAENQYDDDDDDVEIEDVEVTVEIDDSDLDVDEDGDIGDLDADETESTTIAFTVDSDADDDSYDMEVFLEGEDEHGARMGEKASLELDVERKSHDIIIRSANLQEDTMKCTRGSNSINVKIFNLGKKDEDEVSLYVSNDALDLDFELEDIEIDEDDDYSKTVSFTVADDLAAGTYPVRVRAFYSGDDDDGVLADLQDFDFIVEDCVTTTTTPTITTPTTTEPEEVVIPEDVLEEFGITETEESTSFFTSGWFVALLVVLVVAALAGVVVLVVFLVKSPGLEE